MVAIDIMDNYNCKPLILTFKNQHIMKMIAKFVKALDVTSGMTERGEWQRGGMVLRTIGDNERLVAVTAFGENKVALCGQFKTDDVVQVDFAPESREFGDKWFTDLRLIRAQLLGGAPTNQQEGGVI